MRNLFRILVRLWGEAVQREQLATLELKLNRAIGDLEAEKADHAETKADLRIEREKAEAQDAQMDLLEATIDKHLQRLRTEAAIEAARRGQLDAVTGDDDGGD